MSTKMETRVGEVGKNTLDTNISSDEDDDELEELMSYQPFSQDSSVIEMTMKASEEKDLEARRKLEEEKIIKEADEIGKISLWMKHYCAIHKIRY